MKRTLTLALTAVLGAAIAVPAMAQDNFPDTPANHWAYDSLSKLKKDGLLVGYPDGLFRGSRPASRYELAVATHAVYLNLKTVTDGLQEQLKALQEKQPTDLTDVRNAISALQSDVAALKGYGDDIASLKKLTETFDKELRSLGVDVEAIKRDLSDLTERVKKLEARKPSVEISGDVNLLLLGGNSRDDRFGLDKDGRINGISADGAKAGLTKDLTILHEGAFTFQGTNETGPKWKATLVSGNMIGSNAGATAFGDQSSLVGGAYGTPNSDFYVQDFAIKFDTSVAGLGFGVDAGRIGYKISPYILQRPDFTSYYSNDRWDNGEYRFDGAVLGFNLGGAKLDVIAANSSKITSTNGVDINTLVASNNLLPGTVQTNTIDRTLGLNLKTKLSNLGTIDLAYLWLDSDSALNVPVNASTKLANRISVFGGDVSLGEGAIKLDGGYHKSQLQYNTSNVSDKDNSAWNAQLSYKADKFKVFGGYREVEVNYVAPGDWGRLGIIRNPGNIKGFQVGADYDISSSLKLSALGEFDKGKKDISGYAWDTSSKMESYQVKLAYSLNSNLGLTLGYEDTKVKDLPGGAVEPHFRWTTLGLGYGLGNNAKLSLQYEISDHEGLNSSVLGSAYGTAFPTGKATGGLLTTQLTVKF